jgi:hypothetical protein
MYAFKVNQVPSIEGEELEIWKAPLRGRKMRGHRKILDVV